MTSRAKNPRLLGAVLGGAVLTGLSSLSGCVNGADQLYHQGTINKQQYSMMKSQEQQRNRGLALSLLGIGVGARGIKVGNPQAIYAGDALVKIGAAQAGASNTNVYVGGNDQTIPQQPRDINYDSQPKTPQIQMPAFKIEGNREEPLIWEFEHSSLGKIVLGVSNYCKDFNNNGVIDYPGDYSGLKGSFLPNEQITLSAVSSKPGTLEVELLGPNGRIDGFRKNGKAILREHRGLDVGNYSAVFQINNENAGTLQFRVVNSEDKWRFTKR